MTDLVLSFFERDLSSEESQELGRLLESSKSEALRFAQIGEATYLSLGLPAHHWPSKLHWPFNPGSTGGSSHSFLTLALTLAGLGGLATWWFWPKPAAEIPAPLSSVQPSLPATLPKPLPAQKAAGEKPKPLAAEAYLEGRSLKVLVELPHSSLVTVRVLDSQGGEVRHLYTGFLNMGRWSFAWDGRLSSGQSAPAGSYSIQVRSDQGTQEKKVDISVQP